MAHELSNSDQRKTRLVVLNALLGVLFLCGLVFLVDRANQFGVGKIANAESKLEIGQTYECVTSLFKTNDLGWYTIVECEGQYFGVHFQNKPPTKGVVATQKGGIVFLPIAEAGVVIKNPLIEKTAQ